MAFVERGKVIARTSTTYLSAFLSRGLPNSDVKFLNLRF